MTFSIVIPTYNHYDLLNQVLFGIYQKCAPVDEVIVVDDCSTDKDYYDGLSWWKENGMLPVRHLHMSENGGFIKSSNAGLKRAKGDIVCLLSNDVKIGSDIVTSISAVLGVEQKSLVGNRLIDWDSGWNRFGKVIYPYLEGWLLATTADGWKDLGYLDVDLVPNDYEDVALSTVAIAKNYSLIPLNDSNVVHMGGQSIGFNPAREEVTRRNQEKFRVKYVK